MKAPTFKLSDQNNVTHSLEQYHGSWLVLYFYPKDDTPGCTKEACSFRDGLGNLTALGAKVFGVSADNVDSHGKFASKYNLNFPLLADAGAEIAKAYGAYGEKNMYGKIFTGILRHTFLINPEGEIVKTWKKVMTDSHAADVEKVLREAQA